MAGSHHPPVRALSQWESRAEEAMLGRPSRGAVSDEQSARYARHLTLPEVGPEGQRLLTAASILVVGAGGLGSPALL